MEIQRKLVVCPENDELAEYMMNKMQEMAQSPEGISENISMILQKAYTNLCKSKTPIETLKQFSQVKGVGKWLLRLMKGFFEADDRGASSSEESEDFTEKGKKNKRTKRYMPQKNSVAYALLITLYRSTTDGEQFMHKQELIDAAEASGLSRAPIGPEKGKEKPGQFSSPRDWYSGWSCMGNLICKGLVAKSSCPANFLKLGIGEEETGEGITRAPWEVNEWLEILQHNFLWDTIERTMKYNSELESCHISTDMGKTWSIGVKDHKFACERNVLSFVTPYRIPRAPREGVFRCMVVSKGVDLNVGKSEKEETMLVGVYASFVNKCRYMLTEEGKEIAQECLLKSGIVDSKEISASLTGFSKLNNKEMPYKATTSNLSNMEVRHTTPVRKRAVPSSQSSDEVRERTLPVSQSTGKKKMNVIPSESLDRFVQMGFSEEQVIQAYDEVLETSENKDISSIWPSVLCRLREDQVYGQVGSIRIEDRQSESTCNGTVNSAKPSRTADFAHCSNALKACSSTLVDEQLPCLETRSNLLAVPPLANGEQFKDVYEVVLILDDREQFTSRG
ncbi:Crossover junction endonuclease MUS81 [Capsicum annuum]|nr:Crossover junction endonuclease MUS81 [Capsicum annuum]